MSPSLHEFITIDAAPLAAGLLAALTCGLLGNFLVLRRQSLMGDAISHAVLPGLVIAFLVSTSRDPFIMLFGAAIAGIATVVLVELVHRVGGVEQGAAMGVVFSVLFALGVLLIEQAAADHVDLDADCVLYGNLENISWANAPDEARAYLDPATYFPNADPLAGGMPRQVPTLLVMTLLTIAFILVFFKELRLAAFDAGLATALGFHAGFLHHLLMVFVAVAVVAAFEAVGSILVIAMLICPAATARLLTDRLWTQIVTSAVVSIIAGAGGYLLGAFAYTLSPLDHSLSATGMMTVVLGAILTLTIFLSPSHGVVARWLRQRRLSGSIVREDILGLLYRAAESGRALGEAELARVIEGSAARALRQLMRRGEIERFAGGVRLTDAGRRIATTIVRSHRLWERYLVDELGLRPDHVHDTAMRLEHLRAQQGRLEPHIEGARDPHDRAIPADHTATSKTARAIKRSESPSP